MVKTKRVLALVGFLAGLLGILVGLSYFLLLGAVSFAVQGRWDMSFQHTLTTFCMCLGGGALGGMLA